MLVADVPLIQQWTAPHYAQGPDAGRTLVDRTGIAVPQGVPPQPQFSLFLRQRADARGFREYVLDLAQRWSNHPGVRRLRITLLQSDDVKQAAGDYGIKGIASAQGHQFHAWLDLVLATEAVGGQLLSNTHDKGMRTYVSALHAYPVVERYTYVYGGKPTVVGLRGYAAYQAIEEFAADNQNDARFLQWMYGPVVQDGPLDPAGNLTRPGSSRNG